MSDVVKLFFAIGIVAIPVYARIARSSVLSVKEMEYVEAARAIGNSTVPLLFQYVLPNILAPLIVQATLGIGTAELDSAGLSYLGWAFSRRRRSGVDAERCARLLVERALGAVIPGLAISLTVLGFNLLGDGLRDALDPKSK